MTEIGERIRVLRKEHGFSLEELSHKSGVALATLSRLENGKGSGTFKTHQKIAEALGLAISQLYQGFESSGSEEEISVLQPKPEEAETFTYDDKASSIFLASQISGKKMFPQMIVLQAEGRTALEQYGQGTERWVFCLQGHLSVKVGGKEFPLGPGGTIYFKASQPHQFSNLGKVQVKALTVTTPPVL